LPCDFNAAGGAARCFYASASATPPRVYYSASLPNRRNFAHLFNIFLVYTLKSERPPGKPPLALATTSGCGGNTPSSNFSCPMSVAPATGNLISSSKRKNLIKNMASHTPSFGVVVFLRRFSKRLAGASKSLFQKNLKNFFKNIENLLDIYVLFLLECK